MKLTVSRPGVRRGASWFKQNGFETQIVLLGNTKLVKYRFNIRTALSRTSWVQDYGTVCA